MTTRILVVEDEIDLVALLDTLIEFADGIEIVGTHVGGRGVLELAGELQPDVIVLDMMVPNPGGPRLIQLLRRVCDARIFVWTAWDSFLRDTLEPYVDAWYSKTEVHEMVDALEELERRRS